MKKFIAIIIYAMLMLLPSYVYAVDKTVEMPDIKFVVNNQLVKLAEVPLEINGRVLLPLQASLINLGVPSKHIKLNRKDNTVTVVNGAKTVYLNLDSKTACINKIVYIPIQFISNVVDKEVVWDGDTRSILIRDRDKYAKMRSILEKINISMNNIDRVKLISKMKLKIAKKSSIMNLDVSMSEEIDKKAGLLYSATVMPLFGRNISFSAFYKDNLEYIKDVSSGKWDKSLMDEKDFKELISEDVDLNAINNFEVMAASLNRQKSNAKGEYLLTGSLYSKGFAENLGKSADISKFIPESYRFEAVIDESTNLVKKVHAEFSGTGDSGSSRSDVSVAIDVDYKDYNGTFKIKTPDDLLL